MKAPLLLFLLALLNAAAPAQTPEVLRKDLAKREAAAGQDAESLLQVAQWAETSGLAADAKRIYAAILKLKPDHEAANKALGNELVDGQWLSHKDAEHARKSARDAEFKAKGLVEVEGAWVAKDLAADARAGVFHVGQELVTKDEYVALTSGMVRHPVTGQIIPQAELERARSRHFPIGSEDRWVDEQEADRFHAEAGRPWIVLVNDYVLVSTLPIAKIEAIKEHSDRAMARLRPVLGFAKTKPSDRPTVLVAGTPDEFRDYGTKMGDASSAFGAFLATEATSLRIPLQGEVRPAITLWDDAWGGYNLPHAIGIAYVNSLCLGIDTELPAWLLHGLGAFGSRFESPETATWFAQRFAKAGGLRELPGWFKSFAIRGDMEFDEMDAGITQAGFLVAFCVAGPDKEATSAMQELTNAFGKMKAAAIQKAVKGLETTLGSRQKGAADYLLKLVKG